MSADPTQTHVAADFAQASPVVNCRFDPTGRYVFAATQTPTVHRWDLASGGAVAFNGAHDTWVRGLAFSPDGQTLLTGGYDGRLVWWPATSDAPAPIRQVDAHRSWIRALAVSPDGSIVATGGNDDMVRLWNLSDGTLVRELAGHEGHLYSVLFHPSGQWLLSGDLKGKVKQWNVADGSLVREFDATPLHKYEGGQGVDYGGVRNMAFNADASQLICSGLHNASNPLGAVNDPLVMRFEWESQKLLISHTGGDLKGICWAVFHPDGYVVGVSGGSGGGFLLFWKQDQDKDYHRVQVPGNAREMDLHPDGMRIATADHDGHVRIHLMGPKAA